jgi:hypothetical protein
MYFARAAARHSVPFNSLSGSSPLIRRVPSFARCSAMPYRALNLRTVFDRDSKLDSSAVRDADNSSAERVECERSRLVTRLQLDHATTATHNETQLTSAKAQKATICHTYIVHLPRLWISLWITGGKTVG